MVAEVDVHPLTSRTASLRHRNGHQFGSDTLVSRGCGDHSVLDPGVDETIPGHVDEPDKRCPSRATTQPRLCR